MPTPVNHLLRSSSIAPHETLRIYYSVYAGSTNSRKKFPRGIIVIDFESSRARFEKLHPNALRFPREKLTYIGHGDTIAETDLHKVYSLTNLFQQDPYGCRGELSAVFFERC